MEFKITDIVLPEETGYADEEHFFISDITYIPEAWLGKLFDFELLLFCKSGKIDLQTGEQRLALSAGQCALCSDYEPLRNITASADLALSIMGFSWNVIEQHPSLRKHVWMTVESTLRNPIFTPDEAQRSTLCRYLTSIKEHTDKPQPTAAEREIIGLLFQTVIFELLYMTSGSTAADRSDDAIQTPTQGVLLSRSFFEELGRNRGRIRSVEQVAARLNVSAKYLSGVISRECGHPPLHYIHQYAVRAIKEELHYSDKTIKEIAADMGFTSLAFFGKFVKKHLGVSPSEYRLSVSKS